MATVGHYEMQLSSSPYYVSANQQLSPMYDKSKKTWSQRLKITKSEKSPTNTISPLVQQQQYHHRQINEFPIEYSAGGGGSGGLSRSMKYSEPWLYGTVRGIPARPVLHQHIGHHHQAIYAPIPTEVAIMVCSCPEYLTGTKREVKKASVCKKCKGSRLPLAPIGGTVRLRPTSAPILHNARGSAGTMRIPSSSSGGKSRPTILDSQNDPYDVMRRTRLLSPEPASASGTGTIKSVKALEKSFAKQNNSRAKSTSPSRGRSRHRLSNNNTKLNNSSTANNGKLEENVTLRSRSASKQERWLMDTVTIESETGVRRSILHCDVNPYELISGSSLTSNANNKNDDEFKSTDNLHTDDLFNTSKTGQVLRTAPPIPVSVNATSSSSATTPTDVSTANKVPAKKVNNYRNVQAIAGQRISLGDQTNGGSSSSIKQNGENFAYDNVSLQSANGQGVEMITLNNKPVIQHYNQIIDNKLIDDDNCNLYQPKRPPRRKHENCSSTDDDNDNMPSADQTHNNISNNNNHNSRNNNNIKTDYSLTAVALSQISTDLVTSQKHGIKSILKRPSSVSSTVSTSSASDNDAKYTTNNTTSPSLLTTNNNLSGIGTATQPSATSPTTTPLPPSPSPSPAAAVILNGTGSGPKYHSNTNNTNATQIHQKHYYANNAKNSDKISNLKNSKNVTNTSSSYGFLNGIRNSSSSSSNGGGSFGEPKTNDSKTGSQFYLPLPQARKKVQFMVEDKIIQDDPEDEKDNNNCKKNRIIEFNRTAISDMVNVGGHHPHHHHHSLHSHDDNSKKISTTDDVDLRRGRRSGFRVLDDVVHHQHHHHQQNVDAHQDVHNNNNNHNNSSVHDDDDDDFYRKSTTVVTSNPNYCQQLQMVQKQNEIIEELQSESKNFIELNGRKFISNDMGGNGNRSNNNSAEQIQRKSESKNAAGNCTDQSELNHQRPPIKENDEVGKSSLARTTTNSLLRRTNSDRRSNMTTVILNFNDTMALRIKNNRTGTRDLFQTDDNNSSTAQQLIFRPTEPPPPPPPPLATQILLLSATTKNQQPQIPAIVNEIDAAASVQQPIISNANNTNKKNNNNNNNNVNMMTSSCIPLLKVSGSPSVITDNVKSTTTITNDRNSRKGLVGKAADEQHQQLHEELEKFYKCRKSESSSHLRQSFLNNKRTSWNDADIENLETTRLDCGGGGSDQNNWNCCAPPQDERDDKENSLVGKATRRLESVDTTGNNTSNCKSELKSNLNNGNNSASSVENKIIKFGVQQSQSEFPNNFKKHIQAQNEITNGARLFGSSNGIGIGIGIGIGKYNTQKTVVRVAPFNSTLTEVHRLKINHTDDDNSQPLNSNNSLDGQKKTSILINGDDCYSTVNVSNDTQIYQSSVVVTDGTNINLPNNRRNQHHNQHRTPTTDSTDHNMDCTINDTNNFTDTSNPAINTVTINVSSVSGCNSQSRTPEEEIIYKNNKINTLLSLNASKSIIPINTVRCNSDIDNKINTSCHTNDIDKDGLVLNLSPQPLQQISPIIVKNTKRGRTLIKLDFEKSKENCLDQQQPIQDIDKNAVFSHEEELVKILRNPVEAVRRNLIPHVCGKNGENSLSNGVGVGVGHGSNSIIGVVKDKDTVHNNDNGMSGGSMKRQSSSPNELISKHDRNSFIGKLLEDPTLSQLAEGLDGEVVVKLIENSLKRLKENRNNIDTSGTKDNDDMTKLIDLSLQKIQEERLKYDSSSTNNTRTIIDEQERQSNRGSISSGNSYSSANYELFEFDTNNESDCYQSCSSELTTGDEDSNSTRSKFYQMLVDATLSEIEISTSLDDDHHHYESIRLNNGDPIYEEISEVPPPLPLTAPPLNDPELEKKSARSMFEGASKYDILSYLVDARERGIVREESYEYNFNNTKDVIVEEEIDTVGDLKKKQSAELSSRISNLSITSDSSEDTSLPSLINDKQLLSPPANLSVHNNTNHHHHHHQQQQQQQLPQPQQLKQQNSLQQQQQQRKPNSIDIERNDSGVGSETSKSSRSKYQNPPGSCLLNKNSPIHLCEDCDGPVETQITDSGVMYAPLVCRKCGKKRAERKEIITEIVETEEKYGRDLQIILEEFCQPMFVAGLLTQEQLSAIFLNTEELLENNQGLAERMRDALDIALEQGDDDLLTVNIGKIFLESTPMLHAFESYCVRQAASSLLLANLEKEKELLRIFLRVSQMENTVLRRMNLNSFLMVPVQRVTKYPLLLARLFKVTPGHLEGRDLLKQSQEKIELHLNHMNQEAKDVPTKLWRRISSSSPNRRASCEIDMINIKLRKMAIDILEWNHDEVRFTMEGKLLFTQPTDSNWKKGRTIKLTPVNALLVTNGKPSSNYKAEKAIAEQLNFPKHNGIREASLLLVKEKCGRYTLIREPLYLDKCVVCTEADWDDYFEVHEISSKDTFIFKAEDGVRTKHWYKQLQFHAQGMGAWRKRRNALANIMINGMLSRT